MNLSCIICSDLLSSVDDAYVTNCGHIFHYKCLIQWLERSRTCPQCRSKTNERNIHRVYFNIINNDTSLDSGALQSQLDDLRLKLQIKELAQKTVEDELIKLKEEDEKHRRAVKLLYDKLQKKEFLASSQLKQIAYLQTVCATADDLRKEISELKDKIEIMNNVEFVITSTIQEVEELLSKETTPRTLAVLVASLKRELRSSEERRNDLRTALKNTQRDCRKEQDKIRKLEEYVSQIESENYKILEEKKILVKSVEGLRMNSEDTMNLNTSKDYKRKYSSSLNTESPSIAEKVRKIQDSDSPYLKIKSSSIGLAPLLKLGPQNAENTNCREKLSIFKKPRILDNKGIKIENNYAFNGFGISQRKNNFKLFGDAKSTSDRVKSGSLRKIDI